MHVIVYRLTRSPWKPDGNDRVQPDEKRVPAPATQPAENGVAIRFRRLGEAR
jgi:hypothetical protein